MFLECIERDDPQEAVWVGARDGMMCLGVWTEKRLGLGEDAEPTLLYQNSRRRGLIGVYDGLGGSGARHAGVAEGGRQISNAFVASRLAFLTVQDWYQDDLAVKDKLADRLRAVFEDARRPIAGMKIRGTLTRELPTTAALIEYDLHPDRGLFNVRAHWAGDSRCYLLRPVEGLQQLSRDDSAIHDGLETLLADQPMTNLVCAGKPFWLNEHNLASQALPCVLICATDGFFNYVPTPALFEYELLNTLGRSKSLLQWGQQLAAWVRSVASDDATIAVAVCGFDGFSDLQREFAPRRDVLEERHARPMAAVDGAGRSVEEHRALLQEARRTSWNQYRSAYGELMYTPETADLDGEKS